MTIMKRLPFLLAVIACSSLLASCGKNETEPSKPAVNAAYPIDTCVVSGEKLGSMGEPVVLEHEGTTVKFCCKGCIDDFNAEPAKFIAKLKK